MNDTFALVSPKFAVDARNVGEAINNQRLTTKRFASERVVYTVHR